jgi:uncharacterized protein YbaR (Trm112 family)
LRCAPLGTSPSNREALELVARGAVTNDGVNALCCPDCQFPLDLHQPDLEQPMQLLGICESCCKWFFIVGVDDEGNETVLLELPSAELIRLAHAPTRLS